MISEGTKNKILIVDDLEINREILCAILEDKYECLTAFDGESGLAQVKQHFRDISVILLDLVMPGMDGFALLSALKESGITNIPVIVITASNDLEKEKKAFLLGAVDFIPKPFDPDIVHYRVDTHVSLKLHQSHLEEMLEQNIAKTAEIWATVMQSMAEIVESRNFESGQHVKRTSTFSKMILQELSENPKAGYYCSAKDIRMIYETASFHDVGKISISDSVLLKPGRLTEEEYEIMKTHTTLGYGIAKTITEHATPEYQEFCSQIAFCHHEKWDGTGYPSGLKGEKIPLCARVVAIADTYDAITGERPYRPAKSHELAVEEIKRMSGTQFDPYLVKIFVKIEDKIKNAFK